MKRHHYSVLALVTVVLNASFFVVSQDAPPVKAPPPTKTKAKAAKKPRKKGPVAPALAPHPIRGKTFSLTETGHQLDLPAFAPLSNGDIAIAYIDHNGTSDQLWLASKTAKSISPLTPIGSPGIIHDPTITATKDGVVWCFWGQTNEEDVVELKGANYANGKAGKAFTISRTGGSESFADSGIDAKGRIWLTWQSMRNHRPDVYAKFYDPHTEKWSAEIQVSSNEEGDWEPKLSFDNKGNAWIIYDSAQGNEFNLYLAKLNTSGVTATYPISHSPRYEARADIAATIDKTGFWITAEQGKVRWGLDARGHNNSTGINARKTILFGKFDIQSEQFSPIPMGSAGRAGAPVNLPCVGVSKSGSPWVAYRYFDRVLWRIAVSHFSPQTNTWAARRRIDQGAFGQDRSSQLISDSDDKLWFGWTSDLRNTKASRDAGIYLAELDTTASLPDSSPEKSPLIENLQQPFAPSQETPERDFSDHHSWHIDGKNYGLHWGDLHRHTDVSNCRTGFDGCITEHFRYAYDIGKLDFLGTSDHTDIGKIYSPYEWWHNQKMHDVFHTPGKFNSLYVYEREQRWPWGHRNVVFAERGGPIVYIQRARYRSSAWQKQLPAQAGVNEISPPELWDILKRSGKKVAVISHTGATGMGTDWGRYDKIDYSIETIVEIFQGARVSYEGEGAPQPSAGLKPGEAYTINGDANTPLAPPVAINDFGKYKKGTYQNALELGHQLGVFTSSDHISTHVSYGGVFCEENSRSGLVDGFLARRTIAATDKIYLNFTCNGHLLGSIFTSEQNPELWCKVDGTAPLKRVTIVRNEKNWKVFDSHDSHLFEKTVSDESPLKGENRYYIRVEQKDGNMAWSSPVWVTVKS